jgi:hypothetical protein
MTEGWLNNEYLVFFSEKENAELSSAYKFSEYLPGFTLVGLRGWDDFIVIDPKGAMCSVPSVPLDPNVTEEFGLPDNLSLVPDDRFTGKLKWYKKPLIFGGDPQDKDNVAWVTPKQHAELVVWWNEQYKAAKA